MPQFENCGDSSLQRAQHGGLTLGILPSPPYSSFDPLTNKETGIDNRRATLFIVLLGFGCLVGRVFWYHNAQIQHVDLSRAPLLQGIGGLPLLALVTINIRSPNLPYGLVATLVEVPALGILSFLSLPLLAFGGLCYFVYRFVIFRLLIVVR